MYEAQHAGDAAAYCSTLTPNSLVAMERPLNWPPARRPGAAEHRNHNSEDTKPCEERTLDPIGDRPPEVHEITIDGERALAKMTIFGPTGEPVPAKFVTRRVAGAWKVDIPASVELLSFPPD